MSGTESNELDPSKPIVEAGVGPDVMNRLREMGDEKVDDVQVVQPPSETPAEIPELNFDKPDESTENPKEKPDEKKVEASPAKPAEKPKEEPDEKKVEASPAKPADKPEVTTGSVSLTIHGEEKEYTHHDLKAAIGRQSALAKQLSTITNSEALQLGTLMEAAKGGDKAATKKVQTILAKAHGKESIEDLNAELEDVEDEFDETKVLLERKFEADYEEAFASVKDNVDFDDNMDKVKTVLKEKLPEKVYEAYFASPSTRRTMYDLVASGRMQPLLDLFNQQIATLPFEKQLEVRNDPAAFGDAFKLVVQQANANTNQTESEGSEVDPLDSVSTGTKNPEIVQPDGDNPDFLGMSKKDFEEFQRKNRLKT